MIFISSQKYTPSTPPFTRPYFWHPNAPINQPFVIKHKVIGCRPCDGWSETEERGSQIP